MKDYSKIIAGTMTWGKWGKSFGSDEIEQLMHHCIDQGITTFDHADIYGGYTTEEDFGKAFAQSSIARESIQLITKCGIQYPSDRRPLEIKHYDYSKEHILWSVEESLKNLHTEYVDLLLLHRPSPLMNGEEIAAAIDQLKQQGKVHSFGLSNFTTSQTQLIQKHIEVEANQIEFSASTHEAMLDGSLDFMQLHGIQPMAWSPLGGIFKDQSEQAIRIRKQLSELESKYNASSSQLLLAWSLRHPAGILPVIGTTNAQRISDSVKALEIHLEQQDWFKIWVAAMGTKVP